MVGTSEGSSWESTSTTGSADNNFASEHKKAQEGERNAAEGLKQYHDIIGLESHK